MSEPNAGMHFKYLDEMENECRIKISEFSFDGGEWIKPENKTPPKGKVFILKCICGSNDWTSNGRTINEYECNGCGQFVSVLGQ